MGRLAGLIDAVHDGDSAKRRGGSEAYRRSKREGFHLAVDEARKRVASDEELYRAARRHLDVRHTVVGG